MICSPEEWQRRMERDPSLSGWATIEHEGHVIAPSPQEFADPEQREITRRFRELYCKPAVA